MASLLLVGLAFLGERVCTQALQIQRLVGTDYDLTHDILRRLDLDMGCLFQAYSAPNHSAVLVWRYQMLYPLLVELGA